MNNVDWETEQFQRHRPHLQAVAYRMLGSVSEAEDALQDAWLRLSRSQQETIHNTRAWLTTIVGRVCIDMLRARRSRREDYVGAWIPEPIVWHDEQADPEQQTLIADTVGLALLVVLETLTPAERVAYVLHDMFAVPFAEIAETIDSTPEAARQLASRARRRLRGAMPRPDADLAQQREVIDAFLAASRAGDFDALLAVLDRDVVLRDAREPQQEHKGAADVARKFATFGPSFASFCHPATINGQAGLVITTGRGPAGAIGFTVSSGLITTIDLTLDPDRVKDVDQLLSGRRAAAERIINEALSWPGVHRAQGEFGSTELRVGQHELGHLHGDAVADVPLAPKVLDQLHRDGMALDAQGHNDSGWVTVTLESDEGVEHALALLRGNYERATEASGA